MKGCLKVSHFMDTFGVKEMFSGNGTNIGRIVLLLKNSIYMVTAFKGFLVLLHLRYEACPKNYLH
jgi:hypothetical protein